MAPNSPSTSPLMPSVKKRVVGWGIGTKRFVRNTIRIHVSLHVKIIRGVDPTSARQSDGIDLSNASIIGGRFDRAPRHGGHLVDIHTRHWLDYDFVALAVLTTGISVLELIVFSL